MTPALFLDLLQETMWAVILLSAPVLIVAMVVGLAISLVQAVTQIQEATITFVPKILVSLATLIIASPWMLTYFMNHTQALFHRLITMTPH